MLNEIITLAGSTILGSVIKLAGLWMDNQRHMVELLAQKQQVEQKAQEAADASADRAASRAGPWTRRVIVSVVLFTVFVVPFILAAWFPSCPIFYAYNEQSGGFWFFTSAMDKLKFVRIDGFVILPIHTQLASAIAGFYFGAGIIKASK